MKQRNLIDYTVWLQQKGFIKSDVVIEALTSGYTEQLSTEAVKNNAVLPLVSHSSLQNLKTYWVKYDNEWQPTKAHYPYNDRVLYFKFLNGMIVGCDQIPEEHIKPLCYCG